MGCTQTVLYKLYQEKNVKIDKKIAGLMLSAIVSDTLLFKSPTCTDTDREVAKELAKIAELDVDTYGLDMLKAGTDLSSFATEELLTLDAKEMDIKGNKVIVAQVNTASIPDVMKKQNEIEEAIKNVVSEKGLDLFMFVITDIINSNSQTIALGNKADLVEKSYNVKLENNTALLEGVVSRKKQIVPVLTENA